MTIEPVERMNRTAKDQLATATSYHRRCSTSCLNETKWKGAIMSVNERKECESLEDFPELEYLCHKCRGCGMGGGAQGRCVLCGGSGYELTDFGEKVLKLMEHNFRPLFRRMIDGE
jgi:hypothetical protein